MKKVLSILSFLLFFLVSSSGVRAALELTKIGTTSLTGMGIGATTTTYTYPLRSFSLYGNSTASSSVAIKVDDVTYSATANQIGAWSTYLSNLTYDDHAVVVSSTGQTSLNFTLTISSLSATLTPTATSATTASSTVVTTKSLPVSGAVENTFLSLIFALFLVGLGMTIKYKD